jgi:Ca2+-binding EF-hand superfamily protein
MRKTTTMTRPTTMSFFQKDYEELFDLFRLIDYDNRGFVMVSDVLEVLNSLGLEVRTNLLYQILFFLKKNGKEKLDYDEFKDILTKKLNNYENDDDLEKLFGVYRQNNKEIDKDSLKKVAKILGENLEDDDVRRMIQIADTNFDGNVNYNNFYDILTKKYSNEEYEFFNPNKKQTKNSVTNRSSQRTSQKK